MEKKLKEEISIQFGDIGEVAAKIIKRSQAELSKLMDIITIYDELSRKSRRYAVIHFGLATEKLAHGLWVLKDTRF